MNIKLIDSQDVETRGVEVLKGLDAILIPGGFGYRGVEGKVMTARYARENNIPYLGICLGMQVALMEFARNVAGMENANSTEFMPDCKYPVVALITEWRDEDGNVEAQRRKRFGRHDARRWPTVQPERQQPGASAVRRTDHCRASPSPLRS